MFSRFPRSTLHRWQWKWFRSFLERFTHAPCQPPKCTEGVYADDQRIHDYSNSGVRNIPFRVCVLINASNSLERITSNREPHQPSDHLPYRKICAKVQGGTCFGIGVVLERSCGEECQCCSGSAFHRECRNFTFIPHYDIKLTNHDVTSADGASTHLTPLRWI